MTFKNAYGDPRFADAYARLQFPGTYYLAYRDLPDLLARHVTGRAALDFGCGAGRSTRFLRDLGFDAIGVDISEEMIARARAIEPSGDYRLIQDGHVDLPDGRTFDVVLSAFTFDNIPADQKPALFSGLARLLAGRGRLVNLVSSPEIYTHEWSSFSTTGFPENREARTGDIVRIVNISIDDARPVEDVLCGDEAYLEMYADAGLTVLERHAPRGRSTEPYDWVNETRIAPWVIYVLARSG